MAEEKVKKPFYKKWWVWVIIAVFVIGVATQSKKSEASTSGSTAQTSTGETPKQVPAVVVSAEAYYKAYNDNEVSADAKYKGKALEMTGTVESVNKTFGTVHVQLKGAEYFGTVDCSMVDEGSASSMSKGDVVTLIGTGDGKTVFPEVDECVVKK